MKAPIYRGLHSVKKLNFLSFRGYWLPIETIFYPSDFATLSHLPTSSGGKNQHSPLPPIFIGEVPRNEAEGSFKKFFLPHHRKRSPSRLLPRSVLRF